MILSTVVLAGALGAGVLGGSVKTYGERKRKKKYPWTVAAETLRETDNELVLFAKRDLFGEQEGIGSRITLAIRRVHAKSTSLAQEMVAPFVGEGRNQQLQDIALSSDLGQIQAQKEAKKKFVISSASFLFVSAGMIFYAPLSLIGMSGLLYLYSSFLKSAYRTVVKERRVNVQLLYTGVITGALAGGFFFLMALASWYASIVRWLLAKTENHSRKRLVDLFDSQADMVWVVVDGVEVEVSARRLQIGDQVVVTAGQMIPVDGTISAGAASIDQHKLTGEGHPFEAGVGQSVFASTVVLSGNITIWVEKVGSDTVAAQIGDILNNTADFNLSYKSRVESVIEKAVPAMFVLSTASLPWLGLNGALALLWCGPGSRILILAPMSMLNYLHLLSRQGLLIKDGRSLELLNEIDTIIFDKTGTLTEEVPHVRQIFSWPNGRFSEEELLTFAAAAEYRQKHPYAVAILQAANNRNLEVPEIDDSHYEIGYGVKVHLQERAWKRTRLIRVGSERFMEMCGISIPPAIKEEQARCHREGYSLVYVAVDEQLEGTIELVSTIRPEAKEVVRSLRESGKTLYIISGDHEAPTRRLAQELGIEHYFANTLPENKAELVSQLQEEGRSVCFIGDGINDAIALKQAQVSISLRGATTIAMDTAQIVLMDGSLKQLPLLFELAEEFKDNMGSTFMMTLLPKAIGIAGVLFFQWGLFMTLLFNSTWWLPQLGNVMLPLVKHREVLGEHDET